jgi:hypothetical protein
MKETKQHAPVSFDTSTKATKEQKAFARSVARAAKKKGTNKTWEAAGRLKGSIEVLDPSIFEFDY